MSANMVSRETPSQWVPSFDHRVTQCKSTVKVSADRSRNDLQFHRRKTSFPSVIVNSHFSSGTCGVGPADKTGKSVVRCCPGGSFTSPALRRPEKPREIVGIANFGLPPSIATALFAPISVFNLAATAGQPGHSKLRLAAELRTSGLTP